MNKFLVAIGFKRSPDGDVVELLAFRTWHSWVALAVAIAVIAGLNQLWH